MIASHQKAKVHLLSTLTFLMVLVLMASCGNSSKDKNMPVADSSNELQTDTFEIEWARLKDSIFRVNPSLNEVKSFVKNYRDQYDSIPLTINYNDKRYYVVASGKYELTEEKNPSNQIGLVDESNQLLVPIQFQVLYNPGQILPNTMEVEKNGKIGLIHMNGKNILPAKFEVLYPGFGDYLLCFKKNGTYGGLKLDSSLVEIPLEETKSFVDSLYNYESLAGWNYNVKTEIAFQETYSMVEELEFGSGLFFPSQYLVKNGLAKRMVDFVVVGDIASIGETAHKTSITHVQKDPENNFLLLISDFYRTSSEGEGETEQAKIITTVNDNGNIFISRFNYLNEEGLCENKIESEIINDTLVQIKMPVRGAKSARSNPAHFEHYTKYSYLKMTEDGMLSKIKSHKTFPFSSHVPMDSSYLSGCWKKRNQKTHNTSAKQKAYSSLSMEDLEYLENEIYADHGLIFNTNKWTFAFQQTSWYQPKHEKVIAQLTKVEKFNIKFIKDLKKKIIQEKAPL